jgi:hypothetical protein
MRNVGRLVGRWYLSLSSCAQTRRILLKRVVHLHAQGTYLFTHTLWYLAFTRIYQNATCTYIHTGTRKSLFAWLLFVFLFFLYPVRYCKRNVLQTQGNASEEWTVPDSYLFEPGEKSKSEKWVKWREVKNNVDGVRSKGKTGGKQRGEKVKGHDILSPGVPSFTYFSLPAYLLHCSRRVILYHMTSLSCIDLPYLPGYLSYLDVHQVRPHTCTSTHRQPTYLVIQTCCDDAYKNTYRPSPNLPIHVLSTQPLNLGSRLPLHVSRNSAYDFTTTNRPRAERPR